MLRSLRERITFAYVAFVMILFIVVAGILANEAVQVYARNANDSVATAEARIREIVGANPNGDFAALTESVRRSVSASGLRIVGVEHPPGSRRFPPMGPFNVPQGASEIFIPLPPQTGASPPPPPPDQGQGPNRAGGNRVLFSISNLAGLRGARVDSKVATFFISANPSRLQTLLTSYAVLFVAGLVLFGALGLLIGQYLARQALAPMVEVTAALRRFAGGDFTPQHIDTRERSEVGDLAQAFNGAAAQVDAAFGERRRVEEYIRQFVADASHELRTPLTVIRGYLDVLQRGALNDPAKRERAFETLDAETARMRALIDKLIVLARLERPEPSQVAPVDVGMVARNIAQGAHEVRNHPPIRVDAQDGAYVVAEEAEIHEALANLVDNARKYGDGAPIAIEVKRTGSFVTARVIDAGPGIEPDEQAHIFDRFYRGATQREIEGSGLGLSIAAQAVTRAHGTLRLVESRAGHTVFEIKLPAAPLNLPPSEVVPARR